jgi:signal transduction histidine kinase
MIGMNLIAEDDSVETDEYLSNLVADVGSSISGAVELLESLSSYHKIDCGIMELHAKQSIPVISFLEDCVYSFSPQAQRLGVSLTLHIGPPETGE